MGKVGVEPTRMLSAPCLRGASATSAISPKLPHRRGAVEPLNLDYDSPSGVDRAGLEPARVVFLRIF